VRRAVRVAGTVLIGAGLSLLVWALVVWRWEDPFTALYTLYQQHRLAGAYAERYAAYRPLRQPRTTGAAYAAAEQRLIAREARRYRRSLKVGEPLGRLKVPRLHLNIVVVVGTDHNSLMKGPGWYTGTYVPGEGQLIYIAGHRTTYLAPFAHIDSLRLRDRVTLELPYGTFVYVIRGHAIVPADDLARLRSHGREVVALQACHPRFFATHRYIAYARPLRVYPRGGRPYNVSSTAVRPAKRRLS
jgi:sortase A